ncbi:hypothetical protein Patl1_29852 [Pistacia atlantica]|uniref:Uncharacterized protein n=1 Tax=Pistacia atlantica TaxID=434234 RepID=A0ACC1ADZ2_9ROSI|nr:hypothetical protein Patl1_29852 [Pistacia atlantica]
MQPVTYNLTLETLLQQLLNLLNLKPRIAEPGATAVAYAAMLDTGNFVLASRDSANLWESFDNPTDTILPTQIMNQDVKLYASISDTNFSIGRFMFHLQNDGNLLLLTRRFPLDTPNFAYGSAQDSTIGSGFQLIFNQSGYIYVIARNGSILNMVSSNAASTQDFYQRAIVDSDGVFRRYIYPKSLAASGGKWPMRWIHGRFASALLRYTFVDPDDEMKRRQQNFAPKMSEDWCRQVCLNDCFCDAAIFRNGECWKKRVPLSNGRFDSSTGGKALIKEKLGSGAFGTVYKGVLTSDNQNLVAVKKLNTIVGHGEEFTAEISALGRTNHKNLVQLLGLCNEGQHRLLVRMQVASRTANGLIYLHEEGINPIIHCDIKPQNILLDDFLTARISDFRLAKLLKVDQTHTTTERRGTKGYVAPEWFKNCPSHLKWMYIALEFYCSSLFAAEGNLTPMPWMENDKEAMEDMKRVEKFVLIAIWCIQEVPSLRPSMKKVSQMMEGTVEVSIPPDPSSIFSSI